MSRPENENPQERLEKTARELRKHRPRPSEALAARIERLAERRTARRAHSTRLQLSRRRLVLALAAALAIAVAGAIVHGELQSSSSSKPVASEAATNPKTILGIVTHGKSSLKRVKSAPSASTSSFDPYAARQTSSGSAARLQTLKALPPTAAARSSRDLTGSGTTSTRSPNPLANIPLTKRLADLRAVLTLKVENRARLSSATAKAMKIASSFGGFIASADYQAPGRGVASSTLKFKVPATRAQAALRRISTLGEILSQKVSLEDVQRTVAVEADQIKTLEQQIADLERSLSDSSLTSSARSQLQVQLANARANLHSLHAQRSANVRRGRLATITLTLTTGDLPKLPAAPSRIHKAIDRAWDGLSSEISWAAIGLIVASPFLLLATVLALALRYRRRREERRLLEK